MSNWEKTNGCRENYIIIPEKSIANKLLVAEDRTNFAKRFEEMAARNVKETRVYKLAFELSMEIFKISKDFPKEEKYSLTDQVRRSSRSVCACLTEAYRKKQYPAHFVSKVSDSDMENSETGTWLDFAFACKYLNIELYNRLLVINNEIGRLLHHMINNPDKY